MRIIRNILIAVLLPVTAVFGQGGGEWEKNDPRGMETIVFDVVGNKEIKLPPAPRLFEPVPPLAYQRINPQLSYSFNTIDYTAGDITLRLRPRPLAAIPEDKLYGNHVRVGFGNYTTPLLQVYLSNKRQKEFSYGASVDYLSSFRGPVDKQNSAAGRFKASVFGNAYGDKITLSGKAGFERRNMHYYGYVPGTAVDAADIKQFYNQTGLEVGFRNTKSTDDLQVEGRFGLNHQSDIQDAKESVLSFHAKTTLQVLENGWTRVDGGLTYVSRKDPAFNGDDRTMVYAQGGLSYLFGNLLLTGMARIDYVTDTLAGGDGIHFYPILGVAYQLSEKLGLIAGMEGGMQHSTWQGITMENPFIADGAYIAATNKRGSLFGRLEGSITSELGFSGGLEVANYRNSYYFNNSPFDQSRFVVEYDSGNVQVLNPYAGLSYNKNEKYRLGLRTDLYRYDMGRLAAAWHKPTYKVSLDVGVKPVDKFNIRFSSFILGGISAQSGTDIVKLDPAVDLTLGVEYFTGSRMGIFLEGRNLLGSEYALLNNYLVKGIQVLGGLSYKF